MIKDKKHFGKIVAQKNGFDIISCKNCGFKHIYPIPSIEELEYIYKHEYYSKDKPTYINENTEDKKWWQLTYQRRFDVFKKYLITNNSKKLLDIGSGPGLFLEVGSKNNWEVIGVEPNEIAAKYCINKGLNVINSMYDSKLSKKLSKVDLINLSLVLEHISNPIEFLKLTYNQLKKGGLICIVVPNDFNPIQLIAKKLLNGNDWWVAPPHHINYFDFNSLSKLLKNAGFSIMHKESTFPIDFFLLMGDDYINNPTTGKICHSKRKKFEENIMHENNSELLTKIYNKFSNLGIGREIVLIAKKL